MATIADIVATVLLALPFLVLVWRYARVRDFYWNKYDSMADLYQVPRVVLAALAFAAAVFLRRRHGRATGVALGTVAVICALAVAIASKDAWYLYWPHYGPFGDEGWKNLTWIGLTSAALALIPRRIEPVAARRAASHVRSLARFVPPALPAVFAVALAALAWAKLQSIGDHGCGGSRSDAWRDTDILLTTAHLVAAFVVLVPGTRRTGLRFAVLLFEGSAAWYCGQWLRHGAPPGRFSGLGAATSSWQFHATLALILAAGFGLGYLRELHLHAAAAFARHDLSPCRSRMPSLFVRYRAFRRFHRERGARFVWAAPVAAAGLAVLAATTIAGRAAAVLRPFAYDRVPRDSEAEWTIALAAAQLAAAGWLLHADRRARGAHAGFLATACVVAVWLATADTLRDRGPVPLAVWAAACVACWVAGLGLETTDVALARRQLGRAADSLRALRHRLFSTQ